MFISCKEFDLNPNNTHTQLGNAGRFIYNIFPRIGLNTKWWDLRSLANILALIWLQYLFKPVCYKPQWGTGCPGGQISEAKLGGHLRTLIQTQKENTQLAKAEQNVTWSRKT